MLAKCELSLTEIPQPDALTLRRGRHVEVTYHLRVIISASLSADVSVELPLEIVNFVSLDPPPGHVGASPVPSKPQRPVARSWSSADLRGAVRTAADARAPTRMTSMDSLRLEDLEGMRPMSCQKAPALSRVASLESVHTLDLPRAEPVEHLEYAETADVDYPQPRPPRDQPSQQSVIVDRAKERQLRHQMSLQCISSAIASATARRNSPQVTPNHSPAGTAEDGYPNADPRQGFQSNLYSLPPVDSSLANDGLGIQLDDYEDVPEEETGLPYAVGIHGRHESLIQDEELAMLMQSRFSDEDDDEAPRGIVEAIHSPPRTVEVRVTPPTPSGPFVRPASAQRSGSPVHAVKAPRASSPLKSHTSDGARSDSPIKRSPQTPEKFGFATPSSPIKASPEKAAAASSPRVRQPPAPSARTARPLPTPPASTSTTSPTKTSAAAAPLPGATSLRKVPSGTALKRSPGMLRKASSIQSLRSGSAAGPSPSTGSDSSRTLARSPSSLSSPQVSPVLASGTNAAAVFSTTARPTLSPTLEEASAPPRRVVAPISPALRATRSMMDMRAHSASAAATSSASSLSPRKSTILPAVKVKAAALESRQAALTRLATQTGNNNTSSGGRARLKDAPPAAPLSRADSIASSVAPSEFNLKRADSLASFKAPLLRRGGFEEIPPPVPALPRAARS